MRKRRVGGNNLFTQLPERLQTTLATYQIVLRFSVALTAGDNRYGVFQPDVEDESNSQFILYRRVRSHGIAVLRR
jgi:hypothetical protein